MKHFDMNKARGTLKQAVAGIDPLAVDYIDWDNFELELEAVVTGGGPREAVLAVFSLATNRARQARARAQPLFNQ